MYVYPLAELTTFQKRVIKELSHHQWAMRSKEALLTALKDEKRKMAHLLPTCTAMLLDREEDINNVLPELVRQNLIVKIGWNQSGWHQPQEFYKLRGRPQKKSTWGQSPFQW
jgi:hypothetical protein